MRRGGRLVAWALFAVVVQLAFLIGQAARAQTPPAGLSAPDAGCRWVFAEGGGFGLWTQECRLATGLWRVQWRTDLGGFALFRDDDPQAVVLRPWPLPLADQPASVLPGLRAAGLAPENPDCTLVPAALRPLPRTMRTLQLRPAEGWPPARAEDASVPEPPCGPLGASTHAVRYALTDLRWPEWVVFVDEGQDGTLIAPQTLQALPGAELMAGRAEHVAQAIMAALRAECEAVGGGEMTAAPDAVRQFDLGSGPNGGQDLLIDGAGLTCPGAQSLYCGGTGGCRTVLISAAGAVADLLAKGWRLHRGPDQPVVLLQVHGSACGGTNLRRCWRAVVLSEGGFRSPGWP